MGKEGFKELEVWKYSYQGKNPLPIAYCLLPFPEEKTNDKVLQSF